MVEKEAFRLDLFYRINVIRIELPPLRRRMEDIPLLVEHFVKKLNRIRGKAVSGVSQSSLEVLMAHDYPGNIRELENIIEHAFVLCSEGEIQPECLPPSLTRRSPLAAEECKPCPDPLKSAEINAIMDALKRNDYNRKAAAEELGIHKSTLFRKMNKLGIKPPKRGDRAKSDA